MRREVIDGERWIGERLKFLRERLAGDLSGDERQVIEAEVEALSTEGGITLGGLRSPRLLRRLRRRV